MISARGTKLVRLQRRKSGLDFSIKGGKEHGIGVVVSWIKEGGAAKELRLGDEILAVNGQSLFGLSHPQVVSKLRQAGTTVSLLVRPNQTLEDVFSNSTHPSSLALGHTHQERVLSPITPVAEKQEPAFSFSDLAPPLPQGWGQKVDQKTGRVYFENHHTCTSTWMDPRSRKPVPLSKFQWNSLPPGWERFLDSQGDIYYLNHHTQTTHWDCPTGSRQRQLLQQLREFVRAQREKLKTEEEEVSRKRKLLLEKNAQLDLLSSASSQSHDLREVELEGEGESQTDLLDDIMLLNEEVDSEDEQLGARRSRLQFLTGLLQSAGAEEVGERDSHQEAARLAASLAGELSRLHKLAAELLVVVESIGQLRSSGATPLHHILQLPSLVEEKDLQEMQQWVHVCADRLTPKSNCELRLELGLAQETVSYALSLQQRLKELHAHARAHRGWEQLMQELASLDFQQLQFPFTGNTSSFREKVEKWITF